MKTFDELYLEIEQEAIQNSCKNIFADMEKEKDHPLVLYGAGGNCEFALFTLATKAVKATCVCDSKATGVYQYKDKTYDIITPQQLVENYKDAFVLITTWRHEKEIFDFLCQLGFSDTQIYFLRFPAILSPEVFRQKHLNGYRWAYEFFTDKISRECILDRIRLFLLGTPCTPHSLYQDGYFAFPDIKLKENEVYVDGGAYIGDTAEEFILHMKKEGKNYQYIYSFEPDSNNCVLARKNLSIYSKVEIVPYGLWSHKTELKFAANPNADFIGSSVVQGDNEKFNTVSVVSLDEFFADKPKEQWATIIKMDIEGSESQALVGATKLIQEKKPQLIICAYHKPEDIYELPQTILKIRNDYKLRLWQIGESFWDLILYAI